MKIREMGVSRMEKNHSELGLEYLRGESLKIDHQLFTCKCFTLLIGAQKLAITFIPTRRPPPSEEFRQVSDFPQSRV